jgi:hypothetical protein
VTAGDLNSWNYSCHVPVVRWDHSGVCDLKVDSLIV